MLRLTIVGTLLAATTFPALGQNAKWLEERINDNMTMMQYAEKNHERLSKAAKEVVIGPDATPELAEWRYYMPDGRVVSCMRGVEGMIFVYRCREF